MENEVQEDNFKKEKAVYKSINETSEKQAEYNLFNDLILKSK